MQCIDVDVADALLEGLGYPLTTKMSFMHAMGDCFVCARCDPVFREVMDWFNIVRALADYWRDISLIFLR